MKRTILTLMTLCLLGPAPTAFSAQTPGAAQDGGPPADTTALLGQLTLGLKELQVEVVKLQLELQRTRLIEVRRETERAQAERQRLGGQELALKRQAAGLERRLAQADLPSEERAELEALRTQVTTNGPAGLSAERARLAEREAAVAHRLEAERRRWQELADKARAVGVEVNGSLEELEAEALPPKRKM